MNKEIKLQVPESVFLSLTEKANRQGVSLETLCLSLLSEPEELVEPQLYFSLSNKMVKEEIQKVLQSELPTPEVKRRVKLLEASVTRFFK